VIYSIDSLDGSKQWKHYITPKGKLLRVFKGKEPGTLEYHYSTSNKNGKVETRQQVINQADGTLFGSPQLAYFEGESQVLRLPIGEKDKDSRIEVDYNNNKVFSTAKKNIFTFKIEDESITGYTLHNKDLSEAWNIKFSQGEKAIDHSYHLKGYTGYFESADHGFYVQIPEAGNLIYKIVDTHNIAVITKLVDAETKVQSLILYIVNTRRGKILGKYQNYDVDFSKDVNLLYDDNGIFVSYFNRKLSNSEIWVIEVLKNEIESDFMQM
jgi:hypothetical protein